MRSIATAALLVTALVAATGCGVKSTTTDVSPNINRSPTCENAITLFDGRADVTANYYELAWIEVEGNSVWTSDNQMRDKMKKRAAEVGANGLIANPVQQNKVGVNVLGEALGAKTATARASGLAIWMPTENDRTRLACGTR